METVDPDQYGFSNTIKDDDFKAKVYIDIQNERVKLSNYSGDISKVADEIIELCHTQGMDKIICVVPKEDADDFMKKGFVIEGTINGYFKGKDGVCASYFANKERSVSTRLEEEDDIIKKALDSKGQYVHSVNELYNIRTGTEDDAERLAELFKRVFDTYPTPMDDPGYIREVINKNVLFKIVEDNNGNLISAASADMNMEYLNAEITDCATLKEHRGKGLLSELVYHLEEELRERKFISLFSLSRALSPGINIALSKHGYEYTGRHINNCNIMGKFEDMNIWVKNIGPIS